MALIWRNGKSYPCDWPPLVVADPLDVNKVAWVAVVPQESRISTPSDKRRPTITFIGANMHGHKWCLFKNGVTCNIQFSHRCIQQINGHTWAYISSTAVHYIIVYSYSKTTSVAEFKIQVTSSSKLIFLKSKTTYCDAKKMGKFKL